MNFDKNLQYCCEQAITKSTTSDNIIELGKADAANGGAVPLAIMITEGFNNLTSLQIDIQVCPNSDFAADVKTIDTKTYTLSELAGNTILAPKYLPAGAKGFSRLNFTVAGTAPTAGKITAGIVDAHNDDYTTV